MVSRRIWTLRGWRNWLSLGRKMLMLGFSSGWPQLYYTPTHGAAKCMSGLDKPRTLAFAYSWTATLNRQKSQSNQSQKKLANLGRSTLLHGGRRPDKHYDSE